MAGGGDAREQLARTDWMRTRSQKRTDDAYARGPALSSLVLIATNLECGVTVLYATCGVQCLLGAVRTTYVLAL